MDEGTKASIGSQRWSPARCWLRTRSPSYTSGAPPNVAPPHLPHRISLRKRRGRGNAHRTPSQVRRARGRHGACVAHTSCAPPLSLTRPLCSFQRQAHAHTSLLFVPKGSRACSSGAGVAAPQTLCPPACGESRLGAAARAWLGHAHSSFLPPPGGSAQV